jgi:hypothetical protein
MVESITSDTNAALSNLSESSEKLARASMAAGFAMVEGLPDDSPRGEPPSAARRTWRALESYIARCVGSGLGRAPILGAWQQ